MTFVSSCPALCMTGWLTVVLTQGLHSIPGSLLNVNTFERFKAAQEQASQHLRKVRLYSEYGKPQHQLGQWKTVMLVPAPGISFTGPCCISNLP